MFPLDSIKLYVGTLLTVRSMNGLDRAVEALNKICQTASFVSAALSAGQTNAEVELNGSTTDLRH